MTTPIIYWYRADLRLTDLPALVAASKQGPVIPVYVLDDELGGDWCLGGATRWWLHHSLANLKADLGSAGGDLVVRQGETVDCPTSFNGGDRR